MRCGWKLGKYIPFYSGGASHLTRISKRCAAEIPLTKQGVVITFQPDLALCQRECYFFEF
jgi:hypothetical protein